MKETQELARLLSEAKRVFVFTGAGISTASHIPDFRGPNGVWHKRSPVYHQEFARSETARREYWAFKLEGYEAFRDAKPNATHLAIADLERRGRVAAVVTQNVDGLHQAAGTSRELLIELHGTNSEVRCDACNQREPPERCMAEFRATGVPPACTRCGGFMRPAVVMFGEALDHAALLRAQDLSQSADLVVALGSSLVVTPAADIPLYGARSRARRTAPAPYVIVNQGSTPHDALCTLKVDADVTDVFPAAVRLAFDGSGSGGAH